ncbi:NAD-dependent epimerase/dehydratase family protein [soil metagenome]
MRVIVTGGAGFIGSNLVDALLARGDQVVAIDNFTTGRREFLEDGSTNPGLTIADVDIVGGAAELPRLFDFADAVVHLAANADVRLGWNDPRRDLEQNVVGTLNVLDAMRAAGVDRLLFSSTGSVYGDCPIIPTTEDAPFPTQTSLYGASKAAAEGYIAAWTEAGLLSATVFRFVSILGPRYTHGHIIDFVAQLVKDPTVLHVLGDGTQRKSYLDVTDCVAALISQLGERPKFDVMNLGIDSECTVVDSVRWITGRMGLTPQVDFAGGRQGWIGDNPLILLDTTRVQATGWSPVFGIQEAVERTVDYLMANPWLLTEHDAER